MSVAKRTVYVYRPGHPFANENGIVDRALIGYEDRPPAAPNVISDIMPETRHMADGQLYTSKHKFREVTKRHGCIEIGNETATVLEPKKHIPLDRGQRRDDIKRAIWELRNGRKFRND